MVRNTGSAERHRNELRLIHDPVAGVRFDFLGAPLTLLAVGCSNSSVRSVAAGFQWGLRFLSLMMLTLGLAVALLLWRAARALRALPGAGYS